MSRTSDRTSANSALDVQRSGNRRRSLSQSGGIPAGCALVPNLQPDSANDDSRSPSTTSRVSSDPRPNGVHVMKLTRFATQASLVAAAVLALGACSGKASGGGTTTQTSPLCAADPGPAPLRRITRFEYGRTIADLTGVDPSVAQALPPDEETLDFDDIAAAYSVSSLHADRYLEVAEQAAATLTADVTGMTMLAGCDPTGGRRGLCLRVRGRLRPARLATPAHRRRAGGDAAALRRHRRPRADRRPRGGGRGHAAGAAVSLPARARCGGGQLASACRRIRARDAPRVSPHRRGPRRGAARRGRGGRARHRGGPAGPDRSPAERSPRRGAVRSLRQRVVGDRAARHHGQGRVALPGLDRRHAGRARPGDDAVSVRRLEERTDARVAADRAGHVRRRVAGLLLRAAGAER